MVNWDTVAAVTSIGPSGEALKMASVEPKEQVMCSLVDQMKTYLQSQDVSICH